MKGWEDVDLLRLSDKIFAIDAVLPGQRPDSIISAFGYIKVFGGKRDLVLPESGLCHWQC